ncbi:MAG: TRAP transporter substrate-binding protein [Ahrensia sp.]|nr:TRAP transporter substrate-binding protein [Ahrensia sp.]
MKHFIISATTLCLTAMTTAAYAEKWDMPTPYGDTTFHTQNIRQFADDVRTATSGNLDITVHSAGSLFKHAEIKNAVRNRQVQIGEFFLSTLSNEELAFGIDSQPFVATSYEQAEKLWGAQRTVITALLEEQGLMPLFSVPWPPQGLYTKGEIATVADLNGLRFRSYNAALEEFATLAGAAPVQVEASDIPQAFATGQISAMITSPSTGVNSTAWDFVSHYSAINAWVPKNLVVVNKRVFDGLDEATKTAVMTAASAAEARGWKMSAAEAETMTATLAAKGITVYPPSAELTKGLQDIGATMLGNWQAKASDNAKNILKSFQQ